MDTTGSGARTNKLTSHLGMGLEIIDEVPPGPDAWHSQDARMPTAVARYVEEHPGPEAEKFQKHPHDWIDAHRSDNDHLTWTVWILRKA